MVIYNNKGASPGAITSPVLVICHHEAGMAHRQQRYLDVVCLSCASPLLKNRCRMSNLVIIWLQWDLDQELGGAKGAGGDKKPRGN